MNGSMQLQMFEPEGAKLSHLVRVNCAIVASETTRAANLALSGFHSASASRLAMAHDAHEAAAVFEMALQFERLAGLS